MPAQRSREPRPQAPSAAGLRITRSRDGALRFEVAARPLASRSRVAGTRGPALVVQLAAPPVDGAANAELLETLSAALSIPRRQLSLVRGERSRTKLVEVRGLSAEEIRGRLGLPPA
ncbi:MAG: DUF167 domain-containing protein [Myxococcales bacterium]|nr:DUF167 domain-containing protein [Myxococcales bacterium]